MWLKDLFSSETKKIDKTFKNKKFECFEKQINIYCDHIFIFFSAMSLYYI
jgi:hypothetical protein